MGKYGTAGQATDIIRRMRFACWITKATKTYSHYALIFASALQKWLRERASVLHHTFIAPIVLIFIIL
jgi:hypothetical protein